MKREYSWFTSMVTDYWTLCSWLVTKLKGAKRAFTVITLARSEDRAYSPKTYKIYVS